MCVIFLFWLFLAGLGLLELVLGLFGSLNSVDGWELDELVNR